MYITPEQLKQRLNKTDIHVRERERKTRNSKVDGTPEKRLTHEDRVVIGILEQEGSSTRKELAEFAGVTTQTVSNISRNISNPDLGVDQELKADVNASIAERGKTRLEDNEKIKEQLITNLAAALGHVANNLDGTDANEASKIALDMSKILDRVSGDRNERRGNRTAIIINVPPMKEEKAYSSITV